MEMDAILQLIETDEKTREEIQTLYAKRKQIKQSVEEEKKKISDCSCSFGTKSAGRRKG